MTLDSCRTLITEPGAGTTPMAAKRDGRKLNKKRSGVTEGFAKVPVQLTVVSPSPRPSPTPWTPLPLFQVCSPPRSFRFWYLSGPGHAYT
jgi:hypothetical protein